MAHIIKNNITNLSPDEIEDKLGGYKIIDDFSEVCLDTHIRYLIKQNNGQRFSAVDCSEGNGQRFSAVDCSEGNGQRFSAVDCSEGNGQRFSAVDCSEGNGQRFSAVDCSEGNGQRFSAVDCSEGTGTFLYRAGGFLHNKQNSDKYIMLTNGKTVWSVPITNTIFFRKMRQAGEIDTLREQHEKILKKTNSEKYKHESDSNSDSDFVYVPHSLNLDAIPSISSVYITGEQNNQRMAVILDLMNGFVNGSIKTKILIISPNNHGLFSKIYPNATIAAEFNKLLIKDYVNNLKKTPHTIDTKWCVVLDDDGLDKINNKHVIELLNINKVLNMEMVKYPNVKIIIADSNCTGNNLLKQRMNYIILLKSNNISALKRYFHDYGEFFLIFDAFQKYFSMTTNKYDSMIINTAVYKKDILSYVFGFDANKYHNINDCNDEKLFSEREDLNEYQIL